MSIPNRTFDEPTINSPQPQDVVLEELVQKGYTLVPDNIKVAEASPEKLGQRLRIASYGESNFATLGQGVSMYSKYLIVMNLLTPKVLNCKR